MLPVSDKRKEQLRVAQQKWYKKNGRAYQKAWRANHLDSCRERQRINKRKRRHKDRQSLIKAYGSKCQCCGETIPEFLTVDHIKRDGAAHRRELQKSDGRRAGVLIQEWLRRNNYPKDNFRLLCYNCNCASYQCGGICPHKRKKAQ